MTSKERCSFYGHGHCRTQQAKAWLQPIKWEKIKYWYDNQLWIYQCFFQWLKQHMCVFQLQVISDTHPRGSSLLRYQPNPGNSGYLSTLGRIGLSWLQQWCLCWERETRVDLWDSRLAADKLNESGMSELTQPEVYIHGICRWLSASLQYLQCISNGDTAVLH